MSSKVENEDISDEEVRPQNRFAGFSDEGEEEEIKAEISDPEPVQEILQEKPSTIAKKSKRSRKNKNKNKKLKESNESPEINYEDLISDLPPTKALTEDHKATQASPCLKRSTKNFDSSYELQKLFHERYKPKPVSHQKSLTLTPNLKKNLMKINYLPVMELKSSGFSFEMSKGYLKIYQDYLFSVESNDAGLLHSFTNRYPFHIEGLYQLSLIYKMQAKYEQVFQILETILYSYQLSFHHQFSPIGRDIHIDMNSTNLNKIFFKVLFMAIDCLGRKGCYRSALEFTKFLLCLDYKDPMGCLFLLDFYAISIKKYQYYIEFCGNFMKEHFGQDKGLMLPSSLYSLALSKALLSGCFTVAKEDVDRAFGISNLKQMYRESGNVVLLCAVATFPAIAKALFVKLAPSFEFTVENEEIGFDCGSIAEIYAVRNLELWRNEDCVAWIKQAAQEVDIVGSKEYSEAWDYSHLDINDFSFSARNLIPQDLAFGK